MAHSGYRVLFCHGPGLGSNFFCLGPLRVLFSTYKFKPRFSLGPQTMARGGSISSSPMVPCLLGSSKKGTGQIRVPPNTQHTSVNLSKLVQIRPNSSKLFQILPNSDGSGRTQTSRNGSLKSAYDPSLFGFFRSACSTTTNYLKHNENNNTSFWVEAQLAQQEYNGE